MSLALRRPMLTMSTETPQDTFTAAGVVSPVAAKPAPAEHLGGSVAPVAVREPVINAMFRRMFELKASDLHLSATTAPLVRKDGEMRLLHEAAGPLTSEMILRMLTEIMPAINRAEFEARHDTDFAYEIAGLARFRANMFKDRHGAGAVFRVIPAEILTAEQLGLSPHVLNLCQLKKGLVLVTGPTGSGKSTTLCAMTPRRDSESITRICDWRSDGNWSMTRSMVDAAVDVCSVPNTR